MKTIRSIITTAFACAFALITGSAWADGQQEQDENGLSPSFWYKFNGNLDWSGARDLGLSDIGTTYAEGKDGEANTAIIITNGKTVNQGKPDSPQSSLSGDGSQSTSFTISIVAKIAANGQNKVILSEFSKKGNNDGIILAADPINKKILVCKDATTLIEQSIDDITTAFHTYVVTGDGSKVSLYVDGVANSTTSTTYPNTTRTACGICKDGGGGYQTGFAAATGTVVDDFRVYCKTCLTPEQVAKIMKKIYTGKVISINVGMSTTVSGLPENYGSIVSGKDYDTYLGTIPGATWAQTGTPSGSAITTATGNKVYNVNSGETETLTQAFTAHTWATQAGNYAYYAINSSGGIDSAKTSDISENHYYLCVYPSRRDRTSQSGYFEVTNIPFEKYDVYAYFQGSQVNDAASETQFPPIKVTNGNSAFSGGYYKVDSTTGELIPGTTYTEQQAEGKWGSRMQTTYALGVNLVKIPNCSGNLKLEYRAFVSGPCAVQFVERIAEAAMATVPANFSGTLNDLEWTGLERADGVPIELALSGNAELNIAASDVLGPITLKGAGAFTLNTVKSVDIEAGANALVYNYTGTDTISPSITCTGAFTKGGTGAVNRSSTLTPSSFTINDGVLSVGQYYTTGTVTLNGGVYEIVGKTDADIKPTLVFNGGTYKVITTGTSGGNVQHNLITFNDDSFIENSVQLYSLNNGQNQFNYNLNGHKLTKKGAGNYQINTPNFVGGGSIEVQDGSLTLACPNLPSGATLDVTIDDGKTLTINSTNNKNGSLEGNFNVINDGGTFTVDRDITINNLSGTGTFNGSNTPTVKGVLSLPTSATTEAMITGNLTITASTRICFPAGAAENTSFMLCSGTLSGATSGMTQITVGDKTDYATLTYEGGAVKYAWASASTATVSGDAKWSELGWNIEPDATKAVEITFSADSAILTLDESPCSDAKIIGNNSANQIIALQGTAADLTAFLGKISSIENFAGKFVYRYDATSGLTADSTLLNMIKNDNGDKTFVFIGTGNNGATLDFGNPGKTISSHIVFEGGKHAMTVANENRLFANGATGDNPTVLVKDYTTLDFTAKDLSGWSTSVDITGVIRVNDHGVLNFLQNSNGNTFFYHQRLWLDPGSLMTFNYKTTSYDSGAESDFRWNGGTAEATAQIYVPASDTDQTTNPAIIRQVVDGQGGAFHLASDGTKGIAFFVGKNSKLIMDTPFTGKDGRAAAKYGEGVFELVNGTDNVNLTIATASTLVLGDDVSSLALGNDTTVEIADEVTITALSGAYALTKTGAGTLKVANAISGVTSITTQEGTVDLSTQSLPLATTLASGEFKINLASTTATPQKIAPVPENADLSAFTIIGSDDATITQLCVYDGFLWYGQHTTDTYTITTADETELEELPAGGIYSPATLEVNITTVAGTSEGYFAWVENGKAYVAKKSNSISIKLGTRTADRDSRILATDASVGGFPVAGKFWNVAKVSNGNSGNPVSDYTTLRDGNGVASTAHIAYYAVNTYFAKNSPTPFATGNERLLGTYLDDGDVAKDTMWTINASSDGTTVPDGGVTLPATPNNRGWEVQISNIPYDMYDLYVYIATDQPEDGLKACPVTISVDNGATWSYYAGEAKCTDADSWSPLAYSHDGVVTEGKNYIRFRVSTNSMVTDDISTILLSHGTRNTDAKKRLGLAGIQIVEIDDDGVRDRKAIDGSVQNWHDAGSWVQTKKDGTTVDHDWVDSTSSSPITARINASAMPAITMDSAAIVDKLVIAGVAETFTIAGSAALTTKTIDATGFTGNIVFDAPVSGALSLGENAKVVVEIGANEVVNVDGILPEGLTIASGSVTVTGSGTLVCDGKVPEAYTTSLQDSTQWTGTVWLKNQTMNNWNFGLYGNAQSIIKLTGITGNGPNNSTDTCASTLVLEDVKGDNDEITTYALTINNGYSTQSYTFSKLAGTGTFRFHRDDATRPTHQYIFADVTDFDGKIADIGQLKVVIGSGAGTAGVITFADGISVKAGLGWQAAAVAFGKTIKVANAALDQVLVSGVTTKPATLPGLVDPSGNAILDIAVGYDAENQQIKIVEVGAQIVDPVTGETKSYDSIEDAINNESKDGNVPTIKVVEGAAPLAIANIAADKTFKVDAETKAKFDWTETQTKYLALTADGLTIKQGTPANQTFSGEQDATKKLVALGLDASDATDKPYIKAAAEQTEAKKITFNFFHGTTETAITPTGIGGKMVTCKVLYANTADFTGTTTESAAAVDGAVTVELPNPDAGNSAVRYYKPKFTFE